MISDKLHDLLNLLATTIFADKRILAKEIETFLKAADDIGQIYKTDETVSEAKLLSWFDSNVDNIRSKLQTPDFESWFYGCLNRLEGLYDKRALMAIMVDIAKADDDFHISEKALIVLTANHWKLKLPALT